MNGLATQAGQQGQQIGLGVTQAKQTIRYCNGTGIYKRIAWNTPLSLQLHQGIEWATRGLSPHTLPQRFSKALHGQC